MDPGTLETVVTQDSSSFSLELVMVHAYIHCANIN